MFIANKQDHHIREFIGFCNDMSIINNHQDADIHNLSVSVVQLNSIVNKLIYRVNVNFKHIPYESYHC